MLVEETELTVKATPLIETVLPEYAYVSSRDAELEVKLVPVITID